MCENETFKCKYTHVHVRVHCIQQCITYIHNLPDSNAMLLPGRVPGYEESDVKLLASTIIKHTICELYLQAAATISMRAVAYLTFTQLWRQRSGDEADERLVSDLSAEQWSHHAFENRPEEEKSTESIHASVVW